MKTETVNYQSVDQVKADYNFLCGLELPALSVYLIYKGGEKCEYYAFLNHPITKGAGWKYEPYPTVLFHGTDYKPSPLHYVDAIESVIGLLAFLTCKPGDTDDDYFKDYTVDQLAWANSIECEHLQGLVSDFEQGFEQEYFTSKFIQS